MYLLQSRFARVLPLVVAMLALSDATASAQDPQRDLARTRRATAAYHDLDLALEDGFIDTGLPCIEGQGYHFINLDWIGTLDVKQPQLLVYAPDGRLVGLEWFVPGILVGDEPPTLFGQTFHYSSEGDFYFLHVWAWLHNPNGMFADTHPRVHCDD